MPSKQEKERKVNTQPSPGLLQRIFGSSELSPEMEEGVRIARQENPNLAPVQPYGFLSRMLLPQAQGYTSPGKTIYLNPTQLQGYSPQDVADTITHEQTHIGQMGPSALMNFLRTFGDRDPYHQRPDEIEAFQSEIARRSRMGRSQSAYPQFSTGEMTARGDIHLPAKQSKLAKYAPK